VNMAPRARALQPSFSDTRLPAIRPVDRYSRVAILKARAEAQAALDCLLDGWPGLALGVEPERLKWIPRSGLRGLKQLPVIFG